MGLFYSYLMKVPQQLSEADKAALIAYVLGKCMLVNTGILVHEAKVSKQKELRELYKTITDKNVKLSQAFHKMFQGATAAMNPKQVEFLMESINVLISEVWSKADANDTPSPKKESS